MPVLSFSWAQAVLCKCGDLFMLWKQSQNQDKADVKETGFVLFCFLLSHSFAQQSEEKMY